jgi:NitT/TauT family transport system ATP-binding protein
MADRVVVLSRRPGRVLAEIKIELDRPRTERMLGEPAFVAAAERIWSLIRDQAADAMRTEPGPG